MLKLTCCYETSHKNIAFELAITYLKKLFALALKDNCIEIRIISCKALAKLTKLTASFLTDDHLKQIIPNLVDLLYLNNNMGIYICQTLSNLICGLGDLKTNKGSNLISPYWDSLMESLTKCDLNPSFFDRDSNLAVYALKSIEDLINYSSHDKQNKLREYLVFFVLKLKNVRTRTDLDSVFISELESHYCLLIRKIIKKLITQLDLEDCKNIYQVILESFIIRKNVYEEGILAISSLSTSIFLF